MSRGTVSVLALVAMVVAAIGMTMVGAAGAAHGEGPVTVRVGELEVTAGGGFTPKALPKKAFQSLGVTAAGSVKEADGSHPPAVRQVPLEIDKHAIVSTKGLPVCRSGQLQATDTKAAMRACKSALIGTGKTTAQVAFAEQKPIDVPSKLLVFNGGDRGGKVKMFIHAFFSNPISGTIVTTLTFKRIHPRPLRSPRRREGPADNGRQRLDHLVQPEHLQEVPLQSHKTRPFSAECADGKLKVHVLAKFENGTKAETEIVRACHPKS